MDAAEPTEENRPVIVLVEPQMGENIGAAARAMRVFGLRDLRLVRPRDGWPNPAAVAMASGATRIIDTARVFETLDAAIADCGYVLATTARPRESLLPVFDPEAAGDALVARAAAGARCAVLFGGERAGLATDDVARADAILSVPVSPEFGSINLAQAVNIVAYAWSRRAAGAVEAMASPLDAALPAPRDDLERLLEHLEAELDTVGYFRPPEKKPTMVRNLRIALTRAGFTEAEVRTLRGVVKALTRKRDD